ncbi:abscission/NoCut checkpoint regulator isoform X2 [Battus philenor]|uniref:abscission/NoCut checkpoint regulator isoform X2 n=1 Tax=Battus philenor TaxID=42288 RepID=UPI0035CEADAE
MACNSCSRTFTLLRPEVCGKCSRHDKTDSKNIVQPPDAFYRRIANINDINNTSKGNDCIINKTEKDIQERLQKLKENNKKFVNVTDEDLAQRLQNLKEPKPSTSDAELYSKLAKIKGLPVDVVNKKVSLPIADMRTEQEQVDDLMKEYMEQTKIDSQYKDDFEGTITNIEKRLQSLKDSSKNTKIITPEPNDNLDSEDEERSINKIIEKVKAEINLEESLTDATEELPFCEICNEDARVRCIGCKYLFCMRCFNEHKDDDDDCNKYEVYNPPNKLT